MSESKAVIKSVDMSNEMQQEAIDVSTQALEKFNIEKDIAAHIKREFDKKYGPTWHCVVGRNFGSFVTHGKQKQKKKYIMKQILKKKNYEKDKRVKKEKKK
ncbi:unnamed protein product [Cunninghamella echinulata]